MVPTQIWPIPEFTRVCLLRHHTPHIEGEIKTVGKVKRQLSCGIRAQETRDSQNVIPEKAGSRQPCFELKAQGL
ncbi:unnamed protein product [Rangifer tarandus platyrhynchus]|uniref:Uncharacterized protein n=1 Tax=Rangifer tarandus platyrhynchus TaxID=3082113 RepID=A0ABN8ZK20_RANTA|nr:unnamed protein product [Rangifer tarandus platyrhynchus]